MGIQFCTQLSSLIIFIFILQMGIQFRTQLTFLIIFFLQMGIHNTYIRQKLLMCAEERAKEQERAVARLGGGGAEEGARPTAPPASMSDAPSAPPASSGEEEAAAEAKLGGGGGAASAPPAATAAVVETFQSTECVVCLENKVLLFFIFGEMYGYRWPRGGIPPPPRVQKSDPHQAKKFCTADPLPSPFLPPNSDFKPQKGKILRRPKKVPLLKSPPGAGLGKLLPPKKIFFDPPPFPPPLQSLRPTDIYHMCTVYVICMLFCPFPSATSSSSRAATSASASSASKGWRSARCAGQRWRRRSGSGRRTRTFSVP